MSDQPMDRAEWAVWMTRRRVTPATMITNPSLPWVCRNFGHDPRPRPDDPVCRDCGTNLEETMA